MSFSAPQPVNRQPLTKEEIKQRITTVKDLITKITIEEDEKPEALILLLTQYPFNTPEMLVAIFASKFNVDVYSDECKNGFQIVIEFLKPEEIDKFHYFINQASTHPPYEIFKSTGARGWADAILKFGLTPNLSEKLHEMDSFIPEKKGVSKSKRMDVYEQIFDELMVDFFNLGTVDNNGRELEHKDIVGLRPLPKLKQDDFTEILRNCRNGDHLAVHMLRNESTGSYDSGYRFAIFNGLLQYLSLSNWKILINQLGIFRFAVMLADYAKTANTSSLSMDPLFNEKVVRKHWIIFTLNFNYIHSPFVSLNCNPLVEIEEKERETVRGQFRDYLNNIARLFRSETRFQFIESDLPLCMATIVKMITDSGDHLLKDERLNEAEVVLRDVLNHVVSEIDKQTKSNKEEKNAKKPLDLVLLQQYQKQLHLFLAKINHAQLEHAALLSSTKSNPTEHKKKSPNKKELKENVSQTERRLQSLNYYMMADEATLLKSSNDDLYNIGKFMFFINSGDRVFLNLAPTPYEIQERGLKLLKLAVEQGNNLAIQELEYVFIGSSKSNIATPTPQAEQKFFKPESKSSEIKLDVPEKIVGLDVDVAIDAKVKRIQQKIIIEIDNEINKLRKSNDIFKVLKMKINEIKAAIKLIKKEDDKQEIESDMNGLIKLLTELPIIKEEDRLILVAEFFVDLRAKILDLPDKLPEKIIPKIKEIESLFKDYLKPKESKEAPGPRQQSKL